MKNKILIIAWILLFQFFGSWSSIIAGCSDSALSNLTEIRDTSMILPKIESYYLIENDSIKLLPFEVEVVLTPKARQKIIESKETIIVHVSISGVPIPALAARLLSEDGRFHVASGRKEIEYNQIARFDNIKFPRKYYNALEKKDVDVSIFLYTGRKSSKMNLLSCRRPISEKVSKVVNQRLPLNARLIFGDD